MINICGYDLLGTDSETGVRYAWGNARFKNYVESASFINRSKGKHEDISGYTTSVSSGCVLKAMGKSCMFCRTGKLLSFGGYLTYKEIAKQNVFMVLSDMYCPNHPELANKQREFAYMGQGEPGFSYSQVRLAIELTNKIMKKLGQKVYRHVFSTCGVPEAIANYKNDVCHYFTEKVTMHFSLHATNERNLIMPIDNIYPYKESLDEISEIVDMTREKPCVGLLLFNHFQPKGTSIDYSNSINNIKNILDELDSQKVRLSFCEYNSSEELGNAEIYPEAYFSEIRKEVKERGFEAKFFSSYGKEKQSACGMLGGKTPDNVPSDKWMELNELAEELINNTI
jgi:adenine C2-methylase RlmN of 23S rRNA A2503 and tRNA A37